MTQPQRYFVTGTDTDAGKTLASAALLAAASQNGQTTFGLKPVAAGCDRLDNGELRNSDALLHQAFSQPPQPYAVHNPMALEAAIAPHIAATQEGRPLTLGGLLPDCQHSLQTTAAEFQLIEGAGGWLVPLNRSETLADFARQLHDQMPLKVILVVGLRLGCINHAMLTLQAIEASGLEVSGWIANSLSPAMEVENDNLSYLTHALEARKVPLLGHIPWFSSLNAANGEPSLQSKQQAASEAATYLNLNLLDVSDR